MVAELPLPPDLERLNRLFLALNGVHSFMLSHHIQAREPAADSTSFPHPALRLPEGTQCQLLCSMPYPQCC